MKQFFKDFKEFAMRGNVVDMAVGVVIGTAFGKIVSSLVSDIIMPALSLITGRVNTRFKFYTTNGRRYGTDCFKIWGIFAVGIGFSDYCILYFLLSLN